MPPVSSLKRCATSRALPPSPSFHPGRPARRLPKNVDDGDITRIFAEHGGIDHFSIDETGVKGEQQQLVRVAVHTKDGNSAPFGDILIIRTADRGWLVDSRSF